MYDLIVLGATFAAAGIASHFQKRCLVIEPSARAGYEFFGAYSFGTNYEKAAVTPEAQALQEAMLPENGYIYGKDRLIYPYFEGADILFATHLVSTEQTEGGVLCTVHGVNGFSTYNAKAVVDTRSSDAISISKTYNLLIESMEVPFFAGATTEKTGHPHHYTLRCPVPLSVTFCEAREIARKYLSLFSENQKLILSADVFDYQIMPDFPKQSGNSFCLPSKAYENPVLAFDAGLLWAKEVQL